MILSPALRPSVTVLSRSRRLLVAAMLPILVAGFLFAPVHAQTSAVPNLISYQGKVSDATGTFVGATSPENRTVTFRIWSHPTNSLVTDLVYSEQQTVSISGGEFSVLIGMGSAVSGTPRGYSESAKNTTNKVGEIGVFGAITRYLGVTIDDGNGVLTNDPEISPRQQLVSSAYAFRAKYAESLGSNGESRIKVLDSGNVGIGTDNPGAKLEVAGDIRAGGAGTLNPKFSLLANHATTVAASIGYANSAGTLSNDAAAIDTVFKTENGGKLLLQTGSGAAGLVIDSSTSNKVGVGTAAPSAKLDVVSSVVSTPALRVKIATPGTGNVIQAENATSTVFVVQDTGNVGIGMSSPTVKLDVAGAVKATGIDVAGAVTVSGNVGIGTSSPTAKLHVAGGIKLDGQTILEFGAGRTKQVDAGQIGYNLYGAGDALDIVGAGTLGTNRKIQFYNEGGAFFTGYVGIGTTTPRVPLEVSGSNPYNFFHRYYWEDAGGDRHGQETVSVSIISSNVIVALALSIYSDARMKTGLAKSDAEQDLATLLKIDVTDYTYVDRVEKGGRSQKKVIAQQVEKVFPQAVSRSTGVVPDIYRKATIIDGWVQLTTDLKPGERVRLDSEKAEGVHEVLEVQADRFRTAFKPEGDKIFVYGREVKDFRSVDYEAIAMLNVSATQEIKRTQDIEIAALRGANAELTRRVAELEAKDRTRDTRLSAIEKLLQSSSTVIALPAKPATASGQQ